MLPVELFVGPERAPLLTEHRLTDAAVFGPFPYLGVVPRELVSVAAADPRLIWRDAAPVLEDLLNRRVPADDVSVVAGLEDWLTAAHTSGVLSLRASAEVAYATVLELSGSSGELTWREVCARLGVPQFGGTSPTGAALWLVKEGHTSSVWQVRWRLGDDELVACLNVARGAEAAQELLVSSALLRTWHQKSPDHVVDIVATLERTWQTSQGDMFTTVIVSSWIDGLEIHAPAQTDRPARLAAVGWFVNERQEDTGFVARQRIFGRWLENGGEAAWRDLERLLLVLAERGPDGAWLLPDFRINDGDLVWTDTGIVLVGACGLPFVYREGQPSPGYELALWNEEAWRILAAALAKPDLG